MLCGDDQKCDVRKIVARMIKTNQDITGVQCIRNDDGVLAVSDADKKIAWTSYHNKLLNTQFALENNSLFQAGTVSIVLCLIDWRIIRDSVSNMKNGKAAGPSGLKPEIVTTAGERFSMTTHQVNQIIAEVISAEWKISTFVNR